MKTKKSKKKLKGNSCRTSFSTDYLNEFFAQYPDFPYQRDKPSSQEFYRLCDFLGWDREDPERKEAHENFKTALVLQFNSVYGTDVHDMEPWRRLCLELEICPLPNCASDAQKVRSDYIVRIGLLYQSIVTILTNECFGEQTIKRLFVNLVDLVDTRRTGDAVTKFDTLEELQDYTIRTGRYFPKESAYAGGVLKFLLREILNTHRRKPARHTRR